MLRFLSMTNFAIVDKLEVEFGPGFNVLTGEPGAGKSILIDAVSLLMGGRAESTWVRSGAKQARVEGVFVLSSGEGEAIAPAMDELGIAPEGDELFVAREINLEGRNLCRINGQVVPMKALATLGEELVDIHGQGQHLSLFRVREHLDLLDRYGELSALRKDVAKLVAQHHEAFRELAELRLKAAETRERSGLLAFQVQEISRAGLKPDEEEELARERTIGANVQRLQALTGAAYEALAAAEEPRTSAIDQLAQTARLLAQLHKIDPRMSTEYQAVEALADQADDIARRLRQYQDGLETDPRRLEAVEERLDVISRLKRKYGGSVQHVLESAQIAAAELETLSTSESRAQELEGVGARYLEQIGVLAWRLSQARRVAAVRLGEAIEEGLAELGMSSASVRMGLEARISDDGAPVPVMDPGDGMKQLRLAFDATGIDHGELLLSANKGEDLKPLAQVASGGEASRLMLAIKGALLEVDDVPTLVFDEIDSGVGGRVGTVVGRKLWDLARRHQVLCVTHLPQISALADRHLRVEKKVSAEQTHLTLEALAGDARDAEIEAMLGSSGAAARENAREILRVADAWKRLHSPRL